MRHVVPYGLCRFPRGFCIFRGSNFISSKGRGQQLDGVIQKRAITCRYPGNSLSIASIYDEVSVTPIKNIRSNQFPLIFLLPKHWKTEQTIELKHWSMHLLYNVHVIPSCCSVLSPCFDCQLSFSSSSSANTLFHKRSPSYFLLALLLAFIPIEAISL